MIEVVIRIRKYTEKEPIIIDFLSMTAHVKGKEGSFRLHRTNNNMWLWYSMCGMQPSPSLSVTLDASNIIEKAYVQWALEHTILGAHL